MGGRLDMQKGLIRKGLVFSIIVLFIGVGIQPVFANDVSITSTLDNEEDCIECQKSDGISLLRAKILLFKVKVVANVILSSKLGEIPEVKKDCQEILDIIDSSISVDYPIICILLHSYRMSIFGMGIILFDLSCEVTNPQIVYLLRMMVSWLGGIADSIAEIEYNVLNCWEFPEVNIK
jgi:hypothetical protein